MWYIKYSNDNPNAGLTEIQTALNKEFSRPKSEAQSIVGFKEITMKPRETPWELDKRLKCKIREANMNSTDGQHHEWFVASLLPHLRVALSQQNIMTQVEALENSIRLHETSMQDLNLGVQQIHAQLQSLCLEMQSLKQDIIVPLEVRKEIWCLKCKGRRHDKDHFSAFVNYTRGGGPIPLRPEAQAGLSTVPALWRAICQVVGKHTIDNCHLLQKFVQTPQQLFCNFSRSVGHDERNCQSYELMMDKTLAYRVHIETRPPDQSAGMVNRLSGARTRSRWRRTWQRLGTTNWLQLWRIKTLCP